MPDPSHRLYNPMHIIRPDSLPRFWWLYPWTYARLMHRNAVALRELGDRMDDIYLLNSHTISDQSEEIANLRMQLDVLHDSIMAGRAIVPDARPIPEDCES